MSDERVDSLDILTTHWEIGNRAACPCCGRLQENVMAITLGNNLYRLSYVRAQELGQAILSAIKLETMKR